MLRERRSDRIPARAVACHVFVPCERPCRLDRRDHPVWRVAAMPETVLPRAGARDASRSGQRADATRDGAALDANTIIAAAPDPVFVSDLEGKIDRKSTRLNSSHLVI